MARDFFSLGHSLSWGRERDLIRRWLWVRQRGGCRPAVRRAYQNVHTRKQRVRLVVLLAHREISVEPIREGADHGGFPAGAERVSKRTTC